MCVTNKFDGQKTERTPFQTPLNNRPHPRKSRILLHEEHLISELFGRAQWFEGMSRFGVILVVLVFANAEVGHSQWVALNPSILNYSTQTNKVVRAANCEFVNKDSGFILTNKGLGATTDGGETWSLNTTTPGAPQEMSFTSFNNGWIEGDSHYLYHTTDRGSHWDLDSNMLVSALGPNDGYSLYFEDSLRGWQGSSDVSIFATTDGGKTWQSQYSDTNSDANYSLIWISNVAFCNDSLGIALGNYEFEMLVFRTTDGGLSWETVPGGDGATSYFSPTDRPDLHIPTLAMRGSQLLVVVYFFRLTAA